MSGSGNCGCRDARLLVPVTDCNQRCFAAALASLPCPTQPAHTWQAEDLRARLNRAHDRVQEAENRAKAERKRATELRRRLEEAKAAALDSASPSPPPRTAAVEHRLRRRVDTLLRERDAWLDEREELRARVASLRKRAAEARADAEDEAALRDRSRSRSRARSRSRDRSRDRGGNDHSTALLPVAGGAPSGDGSVTMLPSGSIQIQLGGGGVLNISTAGGAASAAGDSKPTTPTAGAGGVGSRHDANRGALVPSPDTSHKVRRAAVVRVAQCCTRPPCRFLCVP